LLAGGNGLTALNVNAIIVFNMAVWLTRTKKYVPSASIPDPNKAANCIAREAASLASGLYSSRNSTSTKYGNAKNRTHEQEQAASQMVQDTLDTITPSSCIFYTDGSARPNPGSCGAGVTLELPKNNHIHLKRLDFHAALGQGTNNLGEIWAIGMAIQSLQISISKRLIATTSTHIFSDSEFAMGALTNTTKTNKNNILNYKAITAIKKMIRGLPKNFVNFHWVPGHADVEGNERADALAELGSTRSASGSSLTHLHARASQGLFLPDDALSKLYQIRPPPWPGDHP
jgi:ribonuclease HI